MCPADRVQMLAGRGDVGVGCSHRGTRKRMNTAIVCETENVEESGKIGETSDMVELSVNIAHLTISSTQKSGQLQSKYTLRHWSAI
jgi:hypothetical protein